MDAVHARYHRIERRTDAAEARANREARRLGRLDEALERMEHAFAELQGEEPDADVAALAAELGRLHIFRGEPEPASERLETALELAESLWLPEVLAQALISKALIAKHRSRLEEALGLTQRALVLAREYELPTAAVRASMNVADILSYRDRCEEAAAQLEQGLQLVRRVGHRFWEATLLGELSWPLTLMGRWQEALAWLEQVSEEQLGLGTFLLALSEPLVARGELEEARRLLSLYRRYEGSADIQERTIYAAARAVVLRAERREQEALVAAEGRSPRSTSSDPRASLSRSPFRRRSRRRLRSENASGSSSCSSRSRRCRPAGCPLAYAPTRPASAPGWPPRTATVGCLRPASQPPPRPFASAGCPSGLP